jgi:hypothetical protein
LNLFKRIKNYFKIKKDIRQLQRSNKSLQEINSRQRIKISELSDRITIILDVTEKSKQLKIVEIMSQYELTVKSPIHHPDRIIQMNETLNKISKIIAGRMDNSPGWRIIERMF